MNFAQLLGHLFLAAEFQHGLAVCLIGRHACRHVLLCQLFDVIAELTVKVSL